jgi:phosphotransferase system enzyme I (PtsI)
MSFAIHGVGVSSGIAIGHAHLVSHALLEVVHYQVPAELIDQEIARFDQAIQTVNQDLEAVRAQLPSRAPA